MHEEARNVYKILVGNLEERRPLGKFRHRHYHNTKVDLKEKGCELDSSGSGQGSVVLL
jgi:hypothetical protein